MRLAEASGAARAGWARAVRALTVIVPTAVAVAFVFGVPRLVPTPVGGAQLAWFAGLSDGSWAATWLAHRPLQSFPPLAALLELHRRVTPRHPMS